MDTTHIKESLMRYYINFNKETNESYDTRIEITKFFQGIMREVDQISVKDGKANSVINDLRKDLNF